jgi:DNA-binding transcriptional MerR regulator
VPYTLLDTDTGYHLFGGPLVCRLAGITYRQLDYWARTGIVEPSGQAARGSGTQRLYTCADLTLLRVLGALRDHGVALRHGREIGAVLRDRGDGLRPGDVIVVDAAGVRIVPPAELDLGGIALLVPVDQYLPECCHPTGVAA